MVFPTKMNTFPDGKVHLMLHGAANAPARGKAVVGGIDDGIDGERGDVAVDDADTRVHSGAVT